jgi:NAD(P)-dependent dehydrogenase (short-subunit alcohol dehydrogenase family)
LTHISTLELIAEIADAAMVKMLAVEFGPSHVRINVICLGAINTEIDDNTRQKNLEDVRIPVNYPEGAIPLTKDKPGKSADVAELVWFLSFDHAWHITGSEVYIDGAQSLLQG